MELSMVAIDKDRSGARPQPSLGESLLTVAGIYGPNASGKSNVVSAMAWLVEAIYSSMRSWDDAIPVDQFGFGASRDGPTRFECDLITNNVRFMYLLELDAEHVLYEALFEYPKKRQRRVFERDGDNLLVQRGLSGLAIGKLLTQRTLVMSLARRLEMEHIGTVAKEVLKIQAFRPSPGFNPLLRLRRSQGDRGFRNADNPWLTMGWFDDSDHCDDDESPRAQALALLRLADLGIEDVVVKNEVTRDDSGEVVRRRKRLSLLHRTTDELQPLDFEEESAGTQAWFGLIGPTIQALRSGGTMVVDELDARLHPVLSAELLRLFHSPAANPRNAQLLFTAHDTSLLAHLNRDEIWLTEKQPDGSTCLRALADFAGERVRKSQNLEAGYLNGRFGAVPRISESEFYRTLGVIG